MGKAYIYILLSDKDKRSYVGSTPDITRRYLDHISGKVVSTKHRRPLRLVYTEELPSLSQAREREKYLKTRQGRRELKELFKRIGV